jgi:hypothetical protein
MSLSAKRDPLSPETTGDEQWSQADKPVAVISSLRPMPKIVPGVDLTEAAQREAEVVIRRAQEGIGSDPFSPFHVLAEQFAEAYDRGLQAAASRLYRTADAVAETIETRPERFIAAVAGAAFVAGFALRIWRSNA